MHHCSYNIHTDAQLLTWQMSKYSFVAIAADIEGAVHFGNVVTQTGRNRRRREEVDFRPSDCLRCPELQQPRAVRCRRWGRWKFGAALHSQNALVKVRVVPHERRLEIVVIAMSMHSTQRWHTKQEAGKGIEQIVVKQQCLKPPAKCHSVRQRLVLQLVARQCQTLQVRHTPNVGGNTVEIIVFQ